MKRIHCLVLYSLSAILLQVVAPTIVHADSQGTGSFTVVSFTADYHLTRDEARVSRLHAVERVTVNFSPTTRNYGIRRTLPLTYQGRANGLVVTAVQNENQKNLDYKMASESQNVVLTIGDPQEQLVGIHTFVITYNASNVTSSSKDSDELMWDANGTEWGQPIEALRVALHLDDSLSSLYSAATCTQGAFGLGIPCAGPDIKIDKKRAATLAFSSDRLLFAGEAVRFRVKFKPHTFSKYQLTSAQRRAVTTAQLKLFIGSFISAFIVVLLILDWRRYGLSPSLKKRINPIVEIPKDASILKASAILKWRGLDVTAEILDLAVRGYIQIIETKERTALGERKRYILKLMKTPRLLKNEELDLLKILFGNSLVPTAKVQLYGLRSSLYKDTKRLESKIRHEIIEQGYVINVNKTRNYYVAAGLLLLLLAYLFTIPLLFVGSLAALTVPFTFHALTTKGAIYRDVLASLRLFMRMGNVERRELLADYKKAFITRRQELKFEEALLGYAMLFNIEKSQAQRIATLDDNKLPGWYLVGHEKDSHTDFMMHLEGFCRMSNATFSSAINSSAVGLQFYGQPSDRH